jgi:diguanylate cyclase (GGDEF)-like protein
LVFASEVAERRRSELEARLLSVSDRLTGLGNYRKLIDSLETEITRSERMKRPFVFVLMDLDRLKQINDVYGHPVGNRALCRVADVLRLHCRSIDIPARFGGDEFALVLPEAGIEFGHRIAERICDRLSSDGEFPSLSISIGLSVWSEGATADSLIQEADRTLYETKHVHKGIAFSKNA